MGRRQRASQAPASADDAYKADADTGAAGPPPLLRFERWVDGEMVCETRDAPDRWSLHEANRATVTLPCGADDAEMGHVVVEVSQRPHALTGGRTRGAEGVGACLWDGALCLGWLLSTDAGRTTGASSSSSSGLRGTRLLELGAGVGLPGATAAMLGAVVTTTERDCCLELLTGEGVGGAGEGGGWGRVGADWGMGGKGERGGGNGRRGRSGDGWPHWWGCRPTTARAVHSTPTGLAPSDVPLLSTIDRERRAERLLRPRRDAGHG